jgi:hypothetical protein
MASEKSSDNCNLKPCPFCKKEFSTGNEMHNHLEQCGSKTERCSHCKNYIQRSLFNFHQENNCAYLNLDINVKINLKNRIKIEIFYFRNQN